MRPVTMFEIDRARKQADEAIGARRECPRRGRGCDCGETVEVAEDLVKLLLRQWWKQDCKDMPGHEAVCGNCVYCTDAVCHTASVLDPEKTVEFQIDPKHRPCDRFISREIPDAVVVRVAA